MLSFELVVLLKLDSQAMALHPDDRIDLGIEIAFTAKRFHSNRVFLEVFRGPCDRTGGKKTKELLQSRRITESGRPEHPAHLIPTLLDIGSASLDTR
jgi:hypothetical protein